MEKYIILEKKVGETPLSCVEAYRKTRTDLESVPLAYAGRLDPMAEGKLLVLVGQECKRQETYHSLDKEYIFEVLFGVSSDSGDVLGLLSWDTPKKHTRAEIELVTKNLQGNIELPYPHFSARTVNGKPLHTWKLEGTIDTISIPTKKTTIHTLTLLDLKTVRAEDVYNYATKKIETIPKVTEARKALGNDFRRVEVRASWGTFKGEFDKDILFTIGTFRCIASSGTYMRTLAEVIARGLHTHGLAYSIKRTTIGHYTPLPFGYGLWRKKY